MCGESHGEHVRQWLYSHIAMLAEHQAISGSFMFLLCKNHPCQSALSVFDKKKIRVNSRYPCSVKRIFVFIRDIRVRQKEYPCSSVSSVFDKKKICCIFCMFHFFFLPLHHAYMPWRVKQVMSCCVGGRHTEVPHASQDIMDWCCYSDRLVRQTAAAHQNRTFTNVSLLYSKIW